MKQPPGERLTVADLRRQSELHRLFEHAVDSDIPTVRDVLESIEPILRIALGDELARPDPYRGSTNQNKSPNTPPEQW